MRRHCMAAVALVIGLAAPAAAQADVYTVTSDSDDVGAGSCTPPDANCTLRAAILRANESQDEADTIVLGAHEVKLLNGELLVEDDLTIVGAGADDSIIDGSGQAARMFGIDAGAERVTFEGVRLTAAQNGAILSRAARLEILSSRIDNAEGHHYVVRQAASEGPSSLVVRDSEIVDNLSGLAPEGAYTATLQLYGSDDATLEVERSTLARNNLRSWSSGTVLDVIPEARGEELTTVRVTDSAVTDNRGARGLRIATLDAGTVDAEVVRSRFERNVGYDAGGIGFYPELDQGSVLALAAEPGESTLRVADSTFDGNTGIQGAAIEIDSPNVRPRVTVTGSTFTGNEARNPEWYARGGAIYAGAGTLAVHNSTFTGNVVEGNDFESGGGALALDGATAQLLHVTIAGNRAEDGARGGGIHGPFILSVGAGRGAQSAVAVEVTNSIVAGNTAVEDEENVGRNAAALFTDDCDASFGIASGGGNLESGESCGFRAQSDKQNADPKLAGPAANGGQTRTMALTAGSPAIDAAVAAACLATDQRGIARVAATCDSGAFELVPPGTQPQPDPQPQPGTQPPPQGGGVLGEEASNECLSDRRFRIRLRVPRGEQVRKAVVLVNGKRVKVKRGKRLTAVIDLRGLEKDRYKVKITLHLKGGGKVSGTRRYWTCTPAIDWPPRSPKV